MTKQKSTGELPAQSASILMLGRHPHPIVTVDVVLLTLKDQQLCAALLQRLQEPARGEWTLPGGWVHTDKDEDALAAASRILKTKAGVESPYLEQLQTFASRHRDRRGWSVSIAHYALIAHDQVATLNSHEGSAPSRSSAELIANDLPRLKWVPIEEIRTLPFDHLTILRTAVDRVQSKTRYSSLPVNLMPKTFTLSELQRVYELILGGPIDKRGFRRRIDELDIVEPIKGQLAISGVQRPAQLYRVKRKRTQQLATADSNIGIKTE